MSDNPRAAARALLEALQHEEEEDEEQQQPNGEHPIFRHHRVQHLLQQTFETTRGSVTALHISRNLRVTHRLLQMLMVIHQQHGSSQIDDDPNNNENNENNHSNPNNNYNNNNNNTSINNNFTMFINAQDQQGNTPIHLAASDGDIEHVWLFLVFGADLSVRNHEGLTPLVAAIRDATWNRDAVVELLLAYLPHHSHHHHHRDGGGNQNVLHDIVEEALQQAIASNHVNTAILLLQVSASSPYSYRVSDAALHFAYEEATVESWEPLLPWLLLHGADIHAPDPNVMDDGRPMTMLEKALERDDWPSARCLLTYGAGVRTVGSSSAIVSMAESGDDDSSSTCGYE